MANNTIVTEIVEAYSRGLNLGSADRVIESISKLIHFVDHSILDKY